MQEIARLSPAAQRHPEVALDVAHRRPGRPGSVRKIGRRNANLGGGRGRALDRRRETVEADDQRRPVDAGSGVGPV